MKIELSVHETALLMELIQNWKTHRSYHMDEIDVINGIAKKIYQSSL